MRSTCSIYVDVGYLLASAATRVTGTSLRNGIHVEFGALVEALTRAAEARCGLPALRVHWYDSARNGISDVQQQRIGELPKVKLRLGRFGVDGQQKGVDLRIGLDLVAHARNQASDVFFLVSGDDDLTEAVEEAQVHGVQVLLLVVPNAEGRAHGVSRHLVRAADELELIAAEIIDAAVMKIEIDRAAEVAAPANTVDTAAPALPAAPAPPARPTPAVLAARSGAPTPRDLAALAGHGGLARPTPPAPASVLAYSGSTGGPSLIVEGYDESQDDLVIDEVAARVLSSFRLSASSADLAELKRAKPSIPRDIDRALLTDAADALGVYDLDERVRFRLRSRFWEKVEA